MRRDSYDNAQQTVAISASPGFTWGRSGSISGPNAWLQNDGVPSNVTGRNFPLYNGELVQVSVSNENSNTFDIQVYQHDGTTYTLLTTVSVVAQRSVSVNLTGILITQGKELAVQVSAGSCKNPVVQLICKGSVLP